MAAKTARTTASLSRLLPNVGGPGRAARGLYANVVASIALYGAPVWAEEAGRRRKILSALRGAQRGIAGRAIKAYRTVSHATATALAGTPPLELRGIAERAIRAYRTVSHATVTALAGTPPLELVAKALAEIYQVITAIKEEQGLQAVTPGLVSQVREAGRRRMLDEWKRWITTARGGGGETLRAIQPLLREWTKARVHLSYRATQILTGHGCFSRYLRRIGKERELLVLRCSQRHG
ncbi:uncharacterized protein [Mycetomoellerius zeteki]|uniref:uncharacterized protein n=1 Tax=Mycetomoellerius zeteki TaxID=64791 RepID=UPI00084EC5CE|nr:PREDICTED: uncharacterized protein LOC108726237 [Trachymyrmex zeteki]